MTRIHALFSLGNTSNRQDLLTCATHFLFRARFLWVSWLNGYLTDKTTSSHVIGREQANLSFLLFFFLFIRSKKRSIVVSQIRLHKSKRAFCCIFALRELLPIFGDDGFQIVADCRRAKLAALGEGCFESCTSRCCLHRGTQEIKCASVCLIFQSISFVHQRTRSC